MPNRTQKSWVNGVFASTPHTLIEKAFIQLALDTESEVYIEADERMFHPFFERLKQEFGDEFRELLKLEFETRDGFSYSRTISDLLRNRLYALLIRKGEHFWVKLPSSARIKQELALEKLQRHPEKKARFFELVEKLRELTPKSLPPAN